MKISSLFPTLVATGQLQNWKAINRKLETAISEVCAMDKMGKDWSFQNYSNGFTSYASVSDLNHRFPAFQLLEKAMTPNILAFGKKHPWNTRGLSWHMTSCWINVMNQTYHTSHLHPFSTVSGVYYVRVPKNSAPLKIEDPRMASLMHAPVREVYEAIDPQEGSFVVFESWVRHEVPINRSKTPRVCISFNYSLESSK